MNLMLGVTLRWTSILSRGRPSRLVADLPSEQLGLPYDSYNRFNLEDINEAECIAEFRFEIGRVLLLEELLQIPALMKCFYWDDGLCLPVKRLAYPCSGAPYLRK